MKAGLSSVDMFDWNDEEISNIIWGGAEEISDRVVPYPEGEEEDGHNESQKQESSAIKHDENKFSGGKLDLNPTRPKCSSASGRNTGVSPPDMDYWQDVASSYDARMDSASLVNEGLNDSSLINKYLPKGIGPQDDELTDFVDYGWENIGSFDDLDRMFSNQEPIFASISLGNSDKIWSACKYTTDSIPKSFSLNANSTFMSSGILSETSECIGVKSKFGKRDEQAHVPSFEKMDDSDITEGGGGESKQSLVVETKDHSTIPATVAGNTLVLTEFADKQSLLTGQTKFKEKTKGKSLPSFQTPSSIDANLAKHSKKELSLPLRPDFPSSFDQQSQVERPGPDTFCYNHISNSYITPPFLDYANPAEEPQQTPNSGSGECQAVFPDYEMTSSDIDSVENPLSSYGKPPIIASHENIAKLRRRRRQMEAMLAIQRQVQQLGDPVSHDLSVQLSALDSPNELPVGCRDELDYLSAFPPIDVSSSNEEDESSALSAAANGYSAVKTVLHRLHEEVAKLDLTLRISIRDSLFRLAKTAVQRQQTSDASASPNGAEQPQIAVEDESDANKNEVKVNDVETDTNPTDRAVAHLLFHRPMENSTKNLNTPESSISAKLNLEGRAQGGIDLEKTWIARTPLKVDQSTSLWRAGPWRWYPLNNKYLKRNFEIPKVLWVIVKRGISKPETEAGNIGPAAATPTPCLQ
ncbi:hypothetical protein MLD38_038230 [Melastoma candidum]|uniref:Uncharacterized protein n=1 Tax=Melastoma candidum TaxID=119954 RepID=A0ACB9KYW3_9MYRT|nr:hypothetical protein MLD38_038230 [Melastoma candidum]